MTAGRHDHAGRFRSRSESCTEAETSPERRFTLAANTSGRFECRWVTLRVEPECRSSWLEPLRGTLMRCPVAHGEGRLAVRSPSAACALGESGQIAFRYMSGGSLGYMGWSG